MSAIAGDERGVIVECPSCHQKNRLSYGRLPEKTQCGKCKAELPNISAPVEVPHLFQAGQSRTSFASPLLMFMATAPPLDEPTTTAGWCLSNSAWAILTASPKSSSGSFGLMTRM